MFDTSIAFRAFHEQRAALEAAAARRRLDLSDYLRLIVDEAIAREAQSQARPHRSRNGARPRPGGALPEREAKLSGRDVTDIARMLRRGL
jgi:hypothetical protein